MVHTYTVQLRSHRGRNDTRKKKCMLVRFRLFFISFIYYYANRQHTHMHRSIQNCNKNHTKNTNVEHKIYSPSVQKLDQILRFICHTELTNTSCRQKPLISSDAATLLLQQATRDRSTVLSLTTSLRQNRSLRWRIRTSGQRIV